MKKIKKLLSDYESWAFSLNVPMAFVAIVLPVITFAFVISFSAFRLLDRHAKNECLDSLFPRRYYELVCEERINDEWIKVDSSSGKVYYYNEPASK